jgi:tetratricopeptide (TPR) repeat protein
MNHINRVQRYLDGEMTEEERRLFEKDIQTDSVLAEEIELHRHIINTVSEHDEVRFRNKLKEAYKLYRGKEKISQIPGFIKNPKYIVYIAGVLTIGVFLLYFGLRKTQISTEELFEIYYTKFSQDVQSRSSKEDSEDNLYVGIYYYYTGDYQESYKRLTLITEEETLATAEFYLGCTEVEMGNYGLAIDRFKDVLNLDFNYYQEHARWYLGLCYLKLNRKVEAIEVFQEFSQKKSYYTENAKKIIYNLCFLIDT